MIVLPGLAIQRYPVWLGLHVRRWRGTFRHGAAYLGWIKLTW